MVKTMWALKAPSGNYWKRNEHDHVPFFWPNERRIMAKLAFRQDLLDAGLVPTEVIILDRQQPKYNTFTCTDPACGYMVITTADHKGQGECTACVMERKRGVIMDRRVTYVDDVADSDCRPRRDRWA